MPYAKGIFVAFKRKPEFDGFEHTYYFTVENKKTHGRESAFIFNPHLSPLLATLNPKATTREKPLLLPVGFKVLAEDAAPHAFGYASVHFVPKKGMIVFRSFFPFRWINEAHKGRFMRQGIASVIHARLARHLADHFPRYRIKHLSNVSPEEKSRLAAMGIVPERLYET